MAHLLQNLRPVIAAATPLDETLLGRLVTAVAQPFRAAHRHEVLAALPERTIADCGLDAVRQLHAHRVVVDAALMRRLMSLS